MKTQILLIGQGIFLDGLNHILAEKSSLEIIGAVDSWGQAHATINDQQPDIIIVDHANADLRVSDLSPLLENNYPKIKVIYLTLADNKMVIHDRRQISGATVKDLLKALQSPEPGEEPAK
jgi:DNA-binding NarL/FixJ family response regulator